jgi:hypothetical protein
MKNFKLITLTVAAALVFVSLGHLAILVGADLGFVAKLGALVVVGAKALHWTVA